jgi:hypothetical protein
MQTNGVGCLAVVDLIADHLSTINEGPTFRPVPETLTQQFLATMLGMLIAVLVLPFTVHAAGSSETGPRDWFWLGEGAAVSLTDGLEALHAGALPRDQRVAAFDRLQLPVSSTLTRATAPCTC